MRSACHLCCPLRPCRFVASLRLVAALALTINAAGTLLAILLILLIASVFIAAGILIAFATGYLTRRFYKLVREQGREGVGAFVQETVQLVTPSKRNVAIAGDESSDGSAVVVE